MTAFLGGMLRVLFWPLTLALLLWAIRRLFPRAEFWLFSPIGTVAKRLLQRLRAGRQ